MKETYCKKISLLLSFARTVACAAERPEGIPLIDKLLRAPQPSLVGGKREILGAAGHATKLIIRYLGVKII